MPNKPIDLPENLEQELRARIATLYKGLVEALPNDTQPYINAEKIVGGYKAVVQFYLPERLEEVEFKYQNGAWKMSRDRND